LLAEVFGVLSTLVKALGIALAILGTGYLIYDNLFLTRMGSRTVVRLVLEGKVSRREIKKILEEKGYKVVK
jgi:hypothetical protein